MAWLRSMGLPEDVARDLVIRDRRKTIRDYTELASVMQAWGRAGGAAKLMKEKR